MHRTLLLPLFLASAGCLSAATHLQVGDQAPGFSLPSTTGGQISLSDFAGQHTVVVAFFPAAFTGG